MNRRLLVAFASIFFLGCSSKVDFTVQPSPPSHTETSDLIISEISTAINTDGNAGGETKPDAKKAGGKSAAKEKPRGVKVIKKRSADARSPDLVEAEIGSAEKQLSDLSEQMGRPEIARDPERYRKLCDDYQQTDARLNALYQEWDQIAREPSNT